MFKRIRSIWRALRRTSLGSLSHALIIRGESTCPIWMRAWLRLDFGARSTKFLYAGDDSAGHVYRPKPSTPPRLHVCVCVCAHTSSRVAPPTGAAWYGRPAASPWASNKHPRTIAFSSERVGNSQQDTHLLKAAALLLQLYGRTRRRGNPITHLQLQI
jgi:hypothetical protein